MIIGRCNKDIENIQWENKYTIHKSKGLEYGTVILPFTSEDISNIKKAKLEANYCDNSLSYTVLFENEIRERNSNYCENKEIEEQVAEESRILLH